MFSLSLYICLSCLSASWLDFLKHYMWAEFNKCLWEGGLRPIKEILPMICHPFVQLVSVVLSMQLHGMMK